MRIAPLPMWKATRSTVRWPSSFEAQARATDGRLLVPLSSTTGVAHAPRATRARRAGQGGGEVRRYCGSRIVPAEKMDIRRKGWRKGSRLTGSGHLAYHPARGRQQALTPHRPAQGCEPGATARETRPLVASREPVCEPHDSTGEPGAGDRGEQIGR